MTGRTISILAPVVPMQLDKQCSKSKQTHIDARRAGEISFHCNVTGNTEKPKQKNNKSKIIIYNAFENGFRCLSCTINNSKRNYHQKDPHKYDMWLMCFPPFCFDQRHHCNTKQKSCKWNAKPYRHLSGCLCAACGP